MYPDALSEQSCHQISNIQRSLKKKKMGYGRMLKYIS